MTEIKPRKLKKKVSLAPSTKSSNIEAHPQSTNTKRWWKKNDSKREEKKGPTTKPSAEAGLKSQGWLSRFDSIRGNRPNRLPDRPLPPPSDYEQSIEPAIVALSPLRTRSSETWQHHDRYFPSFTDADITALSPPPPVPTVSLYSEASQLILEMQAREHSNASGRDVVVHYPDIPAFKEYLESRGPEAIAWGEAKWGTEGWQGYGWGDVVVPEAKAAPAKGGGGGAAQQQAGGGGGKGKGKGGGGGDAPAKVAVPAVVVPTASTEDVLSNDVTSQGKAKGEGGDENSRMKGILRQW